MARRGLRAALASPTPPLLRWLRSTPAVVLDDILQPSALDTALLINLYHT